jgi:hypothetical protein
LSDGTLRLYLTVGGAQMGLYVLCLPYALTTWQWYLTCDGRRTTIDLRMYLGSVLLKISKGTVPSPNGVVGTKSE